MLNSCIVKGIRNSKEMLRHGIEIVEKHNLLLIGKVYEWKHAPKAFETSREGNFVIQSTVSACQNRPLISLPGKGGRPRWLLKTKFASHDAASGPPLWIPTIGGRNQYQNWSEYQSFYFHPKSCYCRSRSRSHSHLPQSF